jgi:peptide/nickel transport system permease protein
MTQTRTPSTSPATKRPPRHGAVRILRDALRTTRGKVGFGLVGIVVLIAVIGPFVAPHSPTQFVTTSYAPPGGSGGVLGGDELGRDVLSRVLDGGWVLLLLAAAATFAAVVVGAVAAVTAAYCGGKIETLIMRLVDVGLALPQIVLALLLVSVSGSSLSLLVFAVAASQAPQVARVMYSSAQDIVERDYVKVARMWGTAPRKVVRREVLPNLMSPLMVDAGIRLSFSIIIVAGLSFLGFGRQPPAADWGVMINEDRLGLLSNPWGVVAPAILLVVLAIGANTFTDAIARTTLAESQGEPEAVAAGVVPA